MSETQFDVLIVGGGMVGATLACALGDSLLRVAVLEATAPGLDWPPADYDNRVSAITRATQRVFQAVGAWDGMVRRRVAPYTAMHVWDQGGRGAIHFDCHDLDEPDLGFIIENGVILAALTERLAGFGNVELICPARVRSMVRDDEAVRLTLADGRTLSGKVVVGADGARSWVREQAKITTTGWTYDHHAVTATVYTSKPHGQAAYQRFLPSGPLAFLPLAEANASSIVWSTSPQEAEALKHMDKAPFLDALQEAFGDILGRMEGVGPRMVTPLLLQHADAYCGERLVLVGNAAHAIHPLAGQGLNLGVLDVAALAEVWLAAHTRHDIGSRAVLRKYERWRKGDNLAVMAAMDGFKVLFGSRLAPVRWARNVGLSLTDRAGPVKQALVRRAMGLSGDLPRMARAPSGGLPGV